MSSGRISYTLFAILGTLAWASDAHAVRVANFDVTGTNSLGSNGGTGNSFVISGSSLSSSCTITVVNNSTEQQQIYYHFEMYENGAALRCSSDGCGMTSAGVQVTLAAAGSSTSSGGTNCTSNSATCTFPAMGSDEFTPLVPSFTNRTAFPSGVTGQVQSVQCKGWIKVINSDDTRPGFVTASGTLTTYSEASAGTSLQNTNGTGQNATTSPSVTPIEIAEGRAI